MQKILLKVEKRKVVGRKVKKLRNEGIIPANIYGADFKSLAVQLDAKEFAKVYLKAGETSLVELQLGKEKNSIPVLIHNVQIDPLEGHVLHVDFFKVNLKKKVTANVPLVLVGVSPAEKQGLGTLVQHINDVEVEALPTDLPENITVDISNLTEVDQAILIKDLEYDKKKVDLKVDPEEVVVKIEVQKVEVEVAPAPVPEEGVEGQPVEGAEGEKTEETPGEATPKEEEKKE
jgi:large subunit ribosomal protein L25